MLIPFFPYFWILKTGHDFGELILNTTKYIKQLSNIYVVIFPTCDLCSIAFAWFCKWDEF